MVYAEETRHLLMEQLANYLYDTLGIRVHSEQWNKQSLPYYLQESFDYYMSSIYDAGIILDKRVLFCVYMENETPVTIEKFLRNVNSSPDIFPVLVQKNIPPYVRRRLVEKRVPFIVPGSHLYLPFIAIDFRERYAKEQEKVRFSSMAQYILLSIMLGTKREWTQFEISQKFSCSRMTASRVFQEFDQFKIANYDERDHRGERTLILKESRFIWEQAQPYLTTPVRKKMCVQMPEFPNQLVSAGESALSAISMLTPPKIPVYAVYTPNKSERASLGLYEVVFPDEAGAIELELWKHQVPLSDQGRINPLALYISLKDNQDERVQGELTKVVNEVTW